MKDNARDLQGQLEEALRRHDVPGASVAIYERGEKVTAAAGLINVETGVPFTSDTVALIGSVTKIFNTTLLMQLVDEGRLALEERVATYLPEVMLKDEQAFQQITVKMLLNHTSGIDGDMLPDHGHDEETIEKAIGRFRGLGQIHPPGEEVSYCNAGSVLAGYLAQRLAGKSWYELVRERLFAPLELEHAVTLPEETVLHRAAVGHYRNPSVGKGPIRVSHAFLPLSFAPCGTTLMLSAEDLVEFASAHMGKGVGANGARILSQTAVEAMQKPTVNTKRNGYMYTDSIGLGWMMYDDGVLHHVGGGPGIVSVLYAYPEMQFAAAILTNAEHGLSVVKEMMETLPQKVAEKRPFEIRDVNLTSHDVQVQSNRYVGTYEGVVHRFRVSGAAQDLRVSVQAKFSCYESMSTDPTVPVRMIPIGDDKFLLDSGERQDGAAVDLNRMFAFRNPDTNGCMRHIGNGMRLYPRVDGGRDMTDAVSRA